MAKRADKRTVQRASGPSRARSAPTADGRARTGKAGAIARTLARLASFLGIFVVLHFAYGWWPNGFTAIFSGVDESVFQHMKVGFYSMLLVAAGEWVFLRPRPASDFAASRLLVAALTPLVFAAVWFLAAAAVGPLPSDAAEIAWANAVLIATGAFAFALEDHLGSRPMPPFLRIAGIALAAAALFVYARFADSRPWTDLFAVPPATR